MPIKDPYKRLLDTNTIGSCQVCTYYQYTVEKNSSRNFRCTNENQVKVGKQDWNPDWGINLFCPFWSSSIGFCTEHKKFTYNKECPTCALESRFFLLH